MTGGPGAGAGPRAPGDAAGGGAPRGLPRAMSAPSAGGPRAADVEVPGARAGAGPGAPSEQASGGADDGALLNLARVVSSTAVEGPGLRFAVWTQGCAIRCPGCCNPQLFHDRPNRLVAPDDLLAELDRARARHPALEGVSLLGGEPFEQDAALARFARGVRARGLTVMSYTGHWREELEARGSPLLAATDLLVDGPYDERLRTTAVRFVGSTNQRLHFLSDAYRPDDPRFGEPNAAELRLTTTGQLVLVGFPFDRVRAAFGAPPAEPRAPAAASGDGERSG